MCVLAAQKGIYLYSHRQGVDRSFFSCANCWLEFTVNALPALGSRKLFCGDLCNFTNSNKNVLDYLRGRASNFQDLLLTKTNMEKRI